MGAGATGSMAAADAWPLVVLMDMTGKKSPDWFTVDLKPCQLKPKRQKVTAGQSARRAATAPVIYRSICLAAPCEDKFPLIWLK